MDCGTIEDAADAERWLKGGHAGRSFEAGAARAPSERAGLNIVRLRARSNASSCTLGQAAITVG